MKPATLALLAMLAALALLVGSCAIQPAPVPTPVPPTPAPTPAPTPSGTESVPTPPVAPPESPEVGEAPWITVGLAWDLSGVTLEPEGQAVVEGGGRRALGAGETMAVTLEHGRAVARGLADRRRWRVALASRETLWVTTESGTTIRWNGRRWRGQFKVFVNPRRKLTLATRVSLEDYLAGVVPGEIGSLAEDLLEAGRAQAIAARSYTLFYRGRRADEGFDLYGTVEDQVYGSVETERPLATRCVASTAGEVALSAGQPIRANYCSTCGGITADVWEAWPAAPLPYLVGHRDGGSSADGSGKPDYCSASPHFRWREEWPAAEFLSNITHFGPAAGVPLPSGWPGRLLDVRVEARSRSGRVWRLRVETSAGVVMVPAWSLRQVLRRPGNPGAILRSNLFKIEPRRVADRVAAVVASGAGSGHGVGLCQTGAIGMARAGHDAEDIIRHYYHGVDVRKLR